MFVVFFRVCDKYSALPLYRTCCSCTASCGSLVHSSSLYVEDAPHLQPYSIDETKSVLWPYRPFQLKLLVHSSNEVYFDNLKIVATQGDLGAIFCEPCRVVTIELEKARL